MIMNKILIISNRSFEYQLVQRSVNHSLTILTLCRFDHNVFCGQKTTNGFPKPRRINSQKAQIGSLGPKRYNFLYEVYERTVQLSLYFQRALELNIKPSF